MEGGAKAKARRESCGASIRRWIAARAPAVVDGCESKKPKTASVEIGSPGSPSECCCEHH